MVLCDNIFTLSRSMTRVEKYHRYRIEIANMKFETLTTKSKVSKEIDKLHNHDVGSKLNYEQVMNVHEVYDDSDTKLKKRKLICLTKYEIFYYFIALIFLLGMIIALILVGLNTWR